MGIGRGDLNAIRTLRDMGHFAASRRVVEIGAQQLSTDLFLEKSWIGELASSFGVAEQSFEGDYDTEVVHGETVNLSPSAPLSRDMWTWLGFDYSSIDMDGSPGSIPLDLNFDSEPAKMKHCADLVTNCGTTEHVINQLNAFKLIHNLTKVGGLMMHNIPAQGYLTHGLVNYTPKFFWSLAAANAYSWIMFSLDQSSVEYALPDDIANEMTRIQPDMKVDTEEFKFRDAGLFIVMRKDYDIHFISPIDVPPGSDTRNPILKKRYWSIFDTPRFHKELKRIGHGKKRKLSFW